MSVPSAPSELEQSQNFQQSTKRRTPSILYPVAICSLILVLYMLMIYENDVKQDCPSPPHNIYVGTVLSAQQQADTLPDEFFAPPPTKSFKTRVFIPKHDPFAFPLKHHLFTCPHTYLENVCYDVLEKRFVKHINDSTRGANINFTNIPYPIGSEKDINPSTRKQKTISWMANLTIYSQLMYKDKGAHFWLAVWPTIHYLDVARRLFKNKQIKHIVLYTDQVLLSRPTYEQIIWQYLLLGLDIDPKTPTHINPHFLNPRGNITIDPDSPVLSIFPGYIPHDSTDYVCFRKMFTAPWLPCKARMANYDEAHRFKQRISYALPDFKPMYHCSESKENMIHLLQRKTTTRRFANILELRNAISQVADVPKANVVVFDSDSRGHFQSDVYLFSKITFLIAAHGAGAMNLIFLPKASHFVEIFPPFFDHEHMYERVAKDIELHYFSFLEKNRTTLDQLYPTLVGNPVSSTLAKRAPVPVTLDGPNQFRSVLRKAVDSYRKICQPK